MKMRNLILPLMSLILGSGAFGESSVIRALCSGSNEKTEIGITISYEGSPFLPGVIREKNLVSGRERKTRFRVTETNASHFPWVDTYKESLVGGTPGLGFSLNVNNETRNGSLFLLNSPFGNQFRNFRIKCIDSEEISLNYSPKISGFYKENDDQ